MMMYWKPTMLNIDITIYYSKDYIKQTTNFLSSLYIMSSLTLATVLHNQSKGNKDAYGACL